MKKFLGLVVMMLPWKLKRFLLAKIWNYDIHPSARIGLSYIYPKRLVMKEHARIGHLNVAVNLDLIVMGANSSIARSNWITGFPTGTDSKHFAFQKGVRKSELVMGRDTAITKHHHIDCTNAIHIGDFTTIAGYYSQLLTHSINVYECRQGSKPITIGDYCFVGTNVKVLGGSKIPSRSVLAAGAVLSKSYENEWFIYGGVPAKPIKEIDRAAKYFTRDLGYVF